MDEFVHVELGFVYTLMNSSFLPNALFLFGKGVMHENENENLKSFLIKKPVFQP